MIRAFRVACILLAVSATSVAGQTTAFNFQGKLNDGTNPANGRYDLRFRLFDAIDGGNQVGATLDKTNAMLVNGVFSTSLDFGAAAFTTGNRFIEISVRPSGTPNPHVILGGRQQVLSVPLAIRATSASNADNATNAQSAVNAQNAVNSQNAALAMNSINATNATNAVSAMTAQNALSLGGTPAADYAQLNTVNTGELRITGNVRQAESSFGLAKAMLFTGDIASSARCYNSVTNSTTYPCGFVFEIVPQFNGVYRIDFGFPVRNRFVSVSAVWDGACVFSQPYNRGVNFRFVSSNQNQIEIFTFAANSANDTFCNNFMIIVF